MDASGMDPMPSREMVDYIGGMSEEECRDALYVLSGYRHEVLYILIQICEGRRHAREETQSTLDAVPR